MKKSLSFAVFFAILVCCGCSNEGQTFSPQDPAENQEIHSKPEKIAGPARYQALVKNNPDIFGEDCLIFSSEEQMMATYDSILGLSNSALINWAKGNSLTNMVVQSNTMYNSAIEDIERAFRSSFDDASPTLLELMKDSLLSVFHENMEYLSCYTEKGITYYEPQEMMSLRIFANDQDIFVVDSVAYVCTDYGIAEIEIDPVLSENSFTYELLTQTTRDSLWAFVNRYGSVYEYVSTNSVGDSNVIPRSTITKGPYQVSISFKASEIQRRFSAIREVTAKVKSYHIIDGVAIQHHCRGTLEVDITTYNNGPVNVSNSYYIRTNKCMKNVELILDRQRYSTMHTPFIQMSTLWFDFQNEHDVEISYP